MINHFGELVWAELALDDGTALRVADGVAAAEPASGGVISVVVPLAGLPAGHAVRAVQVHAGNRVFQCPSFLRWEATDGDYLTVMVDGRQL